MPHLQGIRRNQTLQFPPCLDDYISAENPVRFLDAFVDRLDLHSVSILLNVMLFKMQRHLGSTPALRITLP